MNDYDKVEFLTVDDVFRILKLTRRTVYRYINRPANPLPVVYIGNNVLRIPLDKFKEWIECLEDPRKDV